MCSHTQDLKQHEFNLRVVEEHDANRERFELDDSASEPSHVSYFSLQRNYDESDDGRSAADAASDALCLDDTTTGSVHLPCHPAGHKFATAAAAISAVNNFALPHGYSVVIKRPHRA